MTVKELTDNYPFFPWRDHFNKYLKKNKIISDDQLVYVDNLDYINKLGILLAINNTQPITQANYVMWRTIKSSAIYLRNCLRNEENNFNHFISNKRSDECFDHVSNNFPLIMSALFVRENEINRNESGKFRMLKM